jgi:hypothetical protein
MRSKATSTGNMSRSANYDPHMMTTKAGDPKITLDDDEK